MINLRYLTQLSNDDIQILLNFNPLKKRGKLLSDIKIHQCFFIKNSAGAICAVNF